MTIPARRPPELARFRPQPRRALVAAAWLAGCLLVGDAAAAWLLIGRDDQVRLYIDKGTLQRAGDLAQMHQLTDFVVAQWADAQTAIGSIQAVVEYDCAQPRSRALSLTAYSEQMGAGRAVASETFPSPQWNDIAPGSSSESLHKIACGK